MWVQHKCICFAFIFFGIILRSKNKIASYSVAAECNTEIFSLLVVAMNNDNTMDSLVSGE